MYLHKLFEVLAMCDLGIEIEEFNPKILYTFEKKFTEKNKADYHNHDFLSVIYVLAGSCNYTIDGVPYKVKKGDILIFNPNVFHGKSFLNSGDVTEFHIGFEDIHVKNLPYNHLITQDSSPVINTTKYDQDILKCCNDILNEQGKNEPGSTLLIKALSMKLLVILLRTTYSNAATIGKGVIDFEIYDKLAIVNAITEFINDNYMNELSLDIISQNMYISPAYISKIFKEETGESPINYLIKVRLAKAKEYLKNGSFTIKEIAQSVGYQDAYHFSKLFKKYYGYPPSDIKYKNKCCGGYGA
jgi:AraC-type DNA-binding domain-containing proteins